jgi:predicted nucleotidyltransferase component of viral defense system
MIPQSSIDEWRSVAPWSTDLQVEQDLVVARAVAELFHDDSMRELVAMRGGTVLNKFYFGGGSRYSEDIDLVKIAPGKAGPLFDAIREKLDPWLGNPKREVSERSLKLFYRFESETEPAVPMRLKIETNTVENFSLLGYQDLPFSVQSAWFAGNAQVRTFALNELLGTKVRALYQRKKGRDLFDLWYALVHCDCDPEQIIDCFLKYMEHGGRKIGRKDLELNLQEKLSDSRFLTDVPSLIRTGLEYNYNTACEIVVDKLVSLVPD